MILAMLIVLLMGGVAHAGSYTVTTTPEQDARLARLVARAAAIEKQNLKDKAPATPSLTSQKIIQTWVNQQLITASETDDRASACAKVADAGARKTLGCPPTK